MDKEKYVGNSKVKEKPKEGLTFLLKNGVIKNKHLGDKEIGWEKLSNGVVNKILQMISNAVANLQNQIDSFNEHGMSVSNEFGDDSHIGISQKTLTEAINALWEKLEEVTGETYHGITMAVTPEYFIGETGADVHIIATTVDINGIFEHIAFYGNGQLITEADNVDYFEFDHHIDETTVIQCVAKILGIEYSRQSVVTHYSSFLLGSGDSYEDLMSNNRFLPQYVIPITNGMRGAYDVNVAEGKRIIIVVGDSLSEGFIRADLNGLEIQFTESTCTDADEKVYKVFTSEPWSAGSYNIDING